MVPYNTYCRFLGFSWASGIVTIQGKAYPNGRNQESVSEAIAAYEAVALLGDELASCWGELGDQESLARRDASLYVRDMVSRYSR